jgi:hypothetical protein
MYRIFALLTARPCSSAAIVTLAIAAGTTASWAADGAAAAAKR